MLGPCSPVNTQSSNLFPVTLINMALLKEHINMSNGERYSCLLLMWDCRRLAMWIIEMKHENTYKHMVSINILFYTITRGQYIFKYIILCNICTNTVFTPKKNMSIQICRQLGTLHCQFYQQDRWLLDMAQIHMKTEVSQWGNTE